jgi:hypothetical protein
MARANKIAEIARDKGKTEELLVLPLVNRGGQKLAAAKLGVSQATISKWLEDHGYVMSTFWQKGVTAQEQADIAGAVQRVNEHRRAEGLPTLEEEGESA